MNDTTPEPEEWRAIPGYEGLYEASSLGRIRRLPRILKPVTTHDRPVIALSKNGVVTQRGINQWIAAAFLGACPAGQETRHLNDDAFDNRVSNLAYGDRTANMQDAIRNGKNGKLKRTHCRKNHPYDEENTLWYDGARHCKTCLYAQGAAYRAANPERVRESNRTAQARYRRKLAGQAQ